MTGILWQMMLVSATLLAGISVGCRDAGRANISPASGDIVLLTDAEPSATFDAHVSHSHLPLPERVYGLTFISIEPGERGWKPGLTFEGYDTVTFGVERLAWEHVDVVDWYKYELTDDGNLTATSQKDSQRTERGAFDEKRNELTWNGRRFRLLSPDDENHAAAPQTALSRSLDNDRELIIDLRSNTLSRGRLGFGLGSLTVDTHGTAGGFQVFDLFDELEGGYSITRFRVPVGDEAAKVHMDPQGRVTTSFPNAESKMVRHGNLLLGRPNGPFWRQRLVEAGTETWAAHLLDLREGSGPTPQAGQEVEIRCFFYADDSFENYRPDARQDSVLRFQMPATGASQDLLPNLIRDMKVGGWRRTYWFAWWPGFPSGLVPDLQSNERLYVELHLESVK